MSKDSEHDEDFDRTDEPNYKIGEKKTIEEYNNLDSNDESLNRWKESLGLNKAAAAPVDDPRRVVILKLALEVAGREDVVLDLTHPGALDEIREKPFIIKEGVEFRMKAVFKVQHEVVSGLKYLQVVKRKGFKVDSTTEMIGSYGPNENPYEKKFMTEEAPSGYLARGHYEAKSKFVDDDNVTHIQWNWSFDIKKDWN